jgi:uroporphyrinogen decarboxylase
VNHWQRIEASISGTPSDRIPISLWRHYPIDDQDPGKLARHMVEWQRQWDFDLVKFMPSGTYGVEDWGAVSAFEGAKNGARVINRNGLNRPEEWASLAPLDVRKGSYGAQNEALRIAAPELGAVPILQTIFSPLTNARKLAGEAAFAHMRTHPAAFERGLRTITDVTIEFSLAALEAGAHGVFLATQCATYRSCTRAEYERFGRKYDLEILAALKGKAKLNMLHVHGEDVMFDLLAEYPVEMINWHDRMTAPTLAGARKHFTRSLVGGIDENGAMMSGTAAAIHAEVRNAIEQVNGRGLVIGPGCVLPIAATDSSVRAVIDGAA